MCRCSGIYHRYKVLSGLVELGQRVLTEPTVNVLAESYIKRLGARVVSIEIGDTDSPEGNLIKGIMEQFA